MATLKQIEANRANAQKSTGPRTDEGKAIARQNALKYGMRASEFHLLPSDDATAFQERLDSWIESTRPQDDVELSLVQKAVMLSWKRDQVGRHEAVILSRRVREAIAPIRRERELWVAAAFERLVPAPHHVERFGVDPAGPLLAEFERIAEGCRRLLEQWRLLKRILEVGTAWSENREFTAVRLFGQGPGIITDPATVALVIAARVLRALAEGKEVEFESWDQDRGLRTALDRETVATLWDQRPRDRVEAFLVLTTATDQEIARLESLVEERERRMDPELAEAADLVSFDPSPEGERIRRSLASLDREFLRTLDAIGKRRQQAMKLRLDEARLQKMTNEANSTVRDDPSSGRVRSKQSEAHHPITEDGKSTNEANLVAPEDNTNEANAAASEAFRSTANGKACTARPTKNDPISTATDNANEPNLELSNVGRAVHAFHAGPASDDTNKPNFVGVETGDLRSAIPTGWSGGTRRARRIPGFHRRVRSKRGEAHQLRREGSRSGGSLRSTPGTQRRAKTSDRTNEAISGPTANRTNEAKFPSQSELRLESDSAGVLAISR